MAQAEAFRAKMILEEGDRRAVYQVDFKENAFRIEPEDEGVILVVDVKETLVTLIRKEDKVYCRLSPEEFRQSVDLGIVLPDWFPWVYSAAPDLVEDLEVKRLGNVQLPDGRQGRRVAAYSATYERNLAEYWLDPVTSSKTFFAWREVYGKLWGNGDEREKQSRESRLGVYEVLDGLPVRMEERFIYLTRPRVVRLEDRRALPEDAFTLSNELTEKTPAQLFLEETARRLERWFRPKQ
jgi:hypothetical protein